MFTVDASVHLNALNPAEEGCAESQAFLEVLHRDGCPVYAPTLLLAELGGAVARVLDDAHAAQAMVQAVGDLPGQNWVPLDRSLAERAAQLAAESRLRGADAVYATVALWHSAALVTRDRQQLERLEGVLSVLTPAEALAQLTQMEAGREQG
jgi:predicted nucleic acid-binding protein